MTKHKHLTLSDPNDIQLGLERGETFKAIGQFILKDPTTVSKELNGTDKLEPLLVMPFLALHSIGLPLSVMGALKEDKIVAIRKSSTSLNKLKKTTNKLLSKLVKELLSILKLSGTGIKSFLKESKRDNTSTISSKLITLMSALQPSIDTSEEEPLNLPIFWGHNHFRLTLLFKLFSLD